MVLFICVGVGSRVVGYSSVWVIEVRLSCVLSIECLCPSCILSHNCLEVFDNYLASMLVGVILHPLFFV